MKVEEPGGGLLERLPSRPSTVSDHEFVYAARGLRRPHGRGDEFLGYSAKEMFWKDVLELAHEDDLPRVRALISDAKRSPGSSFSLRPRLLSESGEWSSVKLTLRNVIEAPGDAGLVVANVSAA